MSLPRPPDADVRDRIVAATDVNLSVEAGAGTGKTTLLVDRVASLLRAGTPMSRLAIITFTRKAAAELSARLRRRLAEAAADGSAWATEALQELPRASVGTTDSFCRSILADFPLAAGLPPSFALVDEIAQEALLDLAWDRRLSNAGDEAHELFARLREVGVQPSRLRALAADVVDNRDLEVAPVSRRDAEGVLPLFERLFPAALEAARSCRDPDDLLLERIRELERDLAVARAVGGAAAERVLLRVRRDRKKYATSRGKASSWGGKEGKARAAYALTLLDEAVDGELAARGSALAADVAEWVAAFAREYHQVKRDRGLVDFRDLGLETRALLLRDASVRRRVAARWDVILLDEVQDTDPLQMEIAFLLASAGPPPPDPLDGVPGPGRLFLVGDPKQSIYRFRRADIELYERARARLAATGEGPVITANFRSHPRLLSLVNRVFSGWMERPEDGNWQAAYVPLEPGRPSEDGDDEPRAAVLLPDPETERDLRERSAGDTLRGADRGELEIDSVVRLVRRVTGRDGAGPAWSVRDPHGGFTRPAEPDDVAVLVRKIAWGEELVDALRLAGLPAAVAGGKRFHAREEIRTLAILLDTVLDPEHRLSRFAALRSPAFALPDDDLVRRFDPGPRPAESSARLADAEARLDELAVVARTHPVPEFLERLVEETALLPLFGFRPDGPVRVESLRLLVEAADSLADGGFDTLPAFVRWLREQDSDEGRSVFGELDPGTGAGVEVLTMHKAKGLEFPVVVLADLAGAPVSSAVTLCERATGRLEFRLPGAREVATPGWDEAWEREKLRRDAEEVRLLYVAMTRARDHLVLSWPEGKGGFLSTLPDRLGVAAGVAAQAEDLFTIRAADLPAVGETDRLHRVDVEAALGIARRRGGPDLFAAPDAEESPAAPLLRVTPATVLAGETEDEEHVGPTDERRPAAWSAAEFGTFLHRCLEIVDASADGARTVDTVIARGEWPTPGDDERDVLRSELTRILADPALAPFLAAVADGRIERELPFLLPHGSEWMSGTIDAVWEAEDGIVLVDFKSGRRSIGADGRPHARDEHVRQLSLYARALQDLAWGPVREARLLYLGGRPVHSVTVSIPGAVPAS